MGIPACLASQSWGVSNFLGAGSPILGGLQYFGGSPILGGDVSNFGGSPIFWGSPIFRGFSNFFGRGSPEYGQCSAGTHPTGMHSC